MKEIYNDLHDNITWFWANDPLLENEKDIEKLWVGFYAWCFQNLLEIHKNIHPVLIALEIDNARSVWETYANK